MNTDGAEILMENYLKQIVKDFRKYSQRLIEDHAELGSCVNAYINLISQLQGDILEPEEAVRKLRQLSQK